MDKSTHGMYSAMLDRFILAVWGFYALWEKRKRGRRVAFLWFLLT